MTKKNLLIRAAIFIVLVGMVVPTFLKRVNSEKDNKDVLFAINYNNAAMVLSEDELRETLKENKDKTGVKTALIAEESLNSLINGGYVSAIKYNVLCHKYDDESEEIIKQLAGNKKIHNDSYVLITKRDAWKGFLEKWITSKYTEDEYVKVSSPSDADVYVVYRGVSEAWHTAVGFDEIKLENAKKSGYDIVLSMMLNAHTNTEYIEKVRELVEKYDVKFINIKKTHNDQSTFPNAVANYEGFCSMIREKKLFLILTEEQTQLSNQKPIGYQALIDSAEGRVLRGYDTTDFDVGKNTGATIYEKRYSQILNSVVDRNIRFVSINQLTNGTDSIWDKSVKTNLATEMAINKLQSIGYDTDNYDTVYDNYTVNRRLVGAVALVLMILMCLTMLEWLMGKSSKVLELIALAGAVLSVPFSYVAPESIVLLYPTLFAAVAPCFLVTVMLVYAKDMRDKMSGWLFVSSAAALSLLMLLLCAVVQSSLLSGLDYYLNSLIFRGIKISLIAPIVYSCIAYGLIFSDNSEPYIKRIGKVLDSNIKVYWMLLAAVLGGVAAIYLIRSGNVNSISGAESAMRNTITELMPARPRTKEFLVGWPCLVLFLYSVKNTDCTVLRWTLAVGSSILFASVINSFCHVFTSVGTIYTRVFNGLIIGAVVSLALLVVCYIAMKLFKQVNKNG